MRTDTTSKKMVSEVDCRTPNGVGKLVSMRQTPVSGVKSSVGKVQRETVFHFYL